MANPSPPAQDAGDSNCPQIVHPGVCLAGPTVRIERMTAIPPLFQPWLAAAERLETARERLRALAVDMEPLRERIRALDTATAWQSSALAPFHEAMAGMTAHLDRLREGLEIAEVDIRGEQDRLRAIAGAGP